MRAKGYIYSVVVPLYNEEPVINECCKRLKSVMDSTGEPYEIILVNDGSRDKTLEIAKEICKKYKNIKLVSFSRNFGHQAAITAGMKYSSGRAIVFIDADLQDPPEVILKMIEKWKEGFDVVYGKRVKRKGETFFKKASAKAYYRLLNWMTDMKIPVDAGDFRLIDRKVCAALKRFPERNRYIRGLISWLGFKQTGVEFVREERFAGETEYPLKRMLKLAFDGLASFSYKPLKLPMYIGIIISFLCLIYIVIIVCKQLFTVSATPVWAFIAAISLFFNGVILIVLGIMGEYVARIYDETKGRPLYVVSEELGFEEKGDTIAE